MIFPRRGVGLLIWATLCFPGPAWPRPPRPYVPPLIRVGLFQETTRVDLGPGNYKVIASGSVKRTTWKKPLRFLVVQGGFLAGKTRWGKKIVVEPQEAGGVVLVNGRPYRGAVELERTGPAFRVVNVLSVEDYLRGILQMETSDKWPIQALKAQAVISRTYALRNRGRHGRSGMDFCRTPHCQAYGGATAERPLLDVVVSDTQGEVLVDRRRRLISAVFHSCCGGRTESAENVWEQGGQPYLRPVSCSWCRSSPHNTWVARVKNEVIGKRLATGGYDVGGVRALGILSHTPSGRVYRVRVYGEKGQVDLKANKFRNLIDGHLIRSTFWSGLSRQGDVWQIHGRGWGHGVGLCQWGMKQLAENHMNYGEILRYYYHRVSVVDWRE